jgi:hypothetical protein
MRPKAMILLGPPGSGKTTAKDMLGWNQIPPVTYRQYDHILDQAEQEYRWQQQFLAVTELQPSVHPMLVEYTPPPGYMWLKAAGDGSLQTFGVEKKEFYLQSTESLAAQVIAEVANWRGNVPDIVIEISVRDDWYDLVFSGTLMREMVKLLKSLYHSEAYILQITASEVKRLSNLRNRDGIPITDRFHHHSPAMDILKWWVEGEQNPLSLNRNLVTMTGLPVLLIRQDNTTKLNEYTEGCARTFQALQLL